jgi:hypothetical protein
MNIDKKWRNYIIIAALIEAVILGGVVLRKVL